MENFWSFLIFLETQLNKQIKDANLKSRDLENIKKSQAESNVKQIIPGVFIEYITTTLSQINTDIFVLRTKSANTKYDIFNVPNVCYDDGAIPIINAGDSMLECKHLAQFVNEISHQHYGYLFDIKYSTWNGYCNISAKISDTYRSSVDKKYSTSETFYLPNA